MIACTLFIIPGIPLINAVDDMLNNYIAAGTTRSINTLLIVASMTFGIILAIRIANVADFTTLNVVPDSIYLSHAIFAAIAAAGFSIIFNVPPRLLIMTVIGGIISVCLRNFFAFELGMSQVAGSFIGAVVVGPVSYTHLDVYKRQELGLVDELGNLYDVIDKTAKEVGIQGKVKIKEYGNNNPFSALLESNSKANLLELFLSQTKAENEVKSIVPMAIPARG